MATFVYDAAQHFLEIDGRTIHGFQDGSTITVEFEEDAVTRQVDIDGRNVVFNRSNNYLATVTFTLNEGAADNEILSQIYNAFRNGTGGVVPFRFKDNNTGNTVAQSDACTVQSMPALGGGRESSGREYVLGTGQMTMVVTGAEAVI